MKKFSSSSWIRAKKIILKR